MPDLRTLKIAFEFFIAYGSMINLSGKDGKKAWEDIEKKINHVVNLQWKLPANEIFQHMTEKLGIVEDAAVVGNHSLWKLHHFYLQPARISSKKIANSTTLFQIAYNLGQLKACWLDDFYTNEMKEYFMAMKLFEFETYV